MRTGTQELIFTVLVFHYELTSLLYFNIKSCSLNCTDNNREITVFKGIYQKILNKSPMWYLSTFHVSFFWNSYHVSYNGKLLYLWIQLHCNIHIFVIGHSSHFMVFSKTYFHILLMHCLCKFHSVSKISYVLNMIKILFFFVQFSQNISTTMHI